MALGLMLVSSLAWGCSDDSETMDGDGPSGGGDEVSETIEAAEGGEVATDGAAVDIPADALGEDVEITIAVLDKDDLPDSDNIASEVYDFGPDGTTFDEPVTLTIDFDASDTPDGMRAVMAWLDEDDEWQPLADSEVNGDTVTATTDHFTPFAIIFVAEGQTAGSCEDVGETDCGGDITGTWAISLGCVMLPPDFLVDEETGESPFGDCPELVVNAEIDLSGTAMFDEDGTFALNTTQSSDITITVPETCLPMGAACADLGNAENMVEDLGDSCEIKMMQPEQVNEETGTYEIEGNTLITLGADDTEPDEPAEYCVDGDTLRSRNVSDDGAVIIFQATRQ
jgi:hypothetical protein